MFLGWASLATFDDLFQDEKCGQQTCESLVWNLVLIVYLFSNEDFFSKIAFVS